MAPSQGLLHSTSSQRARPRHGRHVGARACATAWLALALALLPARARAQEAAETPAPATAEAAPASAPAHAARAVLDADPPPVLRPPAPPATLDDLPAWLDYKTRGHVPTLPTESRLFYRRGLALHESGEDDEAQRLVRGAAELDPTFVAPHLTLAGWSVARQPSQALLQLAEVLELIRQDFAVQLTLVINAVLLFVQALFLGLLAAGLIVVWLHQRELRHAWIEHLSLWVSPGSARAWSWAFVLVPFAAGFGIALPTVGFLGLLWPSLRFRERLMFLALLGTLVTMPWTVSALDRLTAPLRGNRAPFYDVALLQSAPFSDAAYRHTVALADAHPESPFAQFGRGWMARRAGDLATAEQSFRAVLDRWPGDDRALNDLGNTLAMQGRADEALDAYNRATRANAGNAAAYYNASQLYTQRFDYRAATEALSRASALDFDLVKNYQSQVGTDGQLPLVDQWIAPRTFWRTLSATHGAPAAGAAVLPPTWRSRLECSGWGFSMLAFLIGIASVGAGMWRQRQVPLRACSNCGEILCRRCAQRRRERALCPACAAVEARAESPEFARVLLHQHRRRQLEHQRLVRTGLAALVPGYGLLSLRHAIGPVLLLTVTAALLSPAFGGGTPFSLEPGLAHPDTDLPLALVVALWVGIYLISLGGYFSGLARDTEREASLSRPVRSRTATATRHEPPAAAA